MMTNSNELQVAFSAQQVDRWDREWLIYLNTEDPAPHLVKARNLDYFGSLKGLSRSEVFTSSVAKTKDGKVQPHLRVWAEGNWIVDQSVLEFGCGTGLVGKNIGPYVHKFLGVDVSDLAVAIATAGRHSNSVFVHVNDIASMPEHQEAYDLWVGREFFIHQNYNMAVETLRRGLPLLKSGARISADFYEPDRTRKQGVIHPARKQLDLQYASCGYYYTESEIAELAQDVGLSVEDRTVSKQEQRQFVVFRKP
jgi:SAM-dependent methyltransferase